MSVMSVDLFTFRTEEEKRRIFAKYDPANVGVLTPRAYGQYLIENGLQAVRT